MKLSDYEIDIQPGHDGKLAWGVGYKGKTVDRGRADNYGIAGDQATAALEKHLRMQLRRARPISSSAEVASTLQAWCIAGELAQVVLRTCPDDDEVNKAKAALLEAQQRTDGLHLASIDEATERLNGAARLLTLAGREAPYELVEQIDTWLAAVGHPPIAKAARDG